MKSWIKKDDKVLVIAGNDKGKTGVVLACGADKVLVKGINVRKKHLKKRTENGKSEIIDIETPIHISNVAPCSNEGTKIKLRSRFLENGEKHLYYVENGKDVVYRTLKKSTKK
jgi:large subunit ribosomal protein L24